VKIRAEIRDGSLLFIREYITIDTLEKGFQRALRPPVKTSLSAWKKSWGRA